MSKPTVESILAQADALVARDRDRDLMYKRMDDLYFMANKKVSTDETVQHVQMPYATAATDLITDLANVVTCTVSVPAAGDSLDDERDAEGLEAWLLAWLSKNGKLQGRKIIGEAAFLAAQRACCIARLTYVDSSVKIPPTLDEEVTVTGLPVVIQLRDPLVVHVLDGPLGPRMVVERWKRLAADVRATYENVLDKDIDDDVEGEWTEVWTDKWRACFWDGESIKQKGGRVWMHGYGCLPYSFGYGRTTPFRDTAKRFRPVLVGVESLVGNIDTWYSILLTAGLSAVINAWAVYSDQYSTEGDKKIDLSAGAVNYLSAGDKLQAIQRAEMPGDFFQLGSLLLQAFQTQTFPLALYGQSPGDMAGYAISLLSQAGRRIILPIWGAIESMLAGAMLNCVTICTNKVAPLVGNKIPLVITERSSPTARRVKRKLRLDVTKFGDDLDLTVHLGDPMPADEAGALRMATEATKNNLLSNQTALEKYKLSTEPAAEMDRIAVEAIWRQLAPIEGLKLAQERGYAPKDITIPKGFVAGPQGLLIPQALMDSAKGAQQAEQTPPPQQGAPQGMPASQSQPPPGVPPAGALPQDGAGMPPMDAAMMQQPGGMLPGQPPQGMPQLTPEMLQQLMQMIQAGMRPAPSGTGEPTGRPNIMDMQALAGRPIEPRLEDMSGGQQPMGAGGF